MNFLKRLRVLPVLLGVAATFAAVSTTLLGDTRPGAAPPVVLGEPPRPDGGRIVDELAVTKFSKLPVLTYQPKDGELLLFIDQFEEVFTLVSDESERDLFLKSILHCIYVQCTINERHIY